VIVGEGEAEWPSGVGERGKPTMAVSQSLLSRGGGK